MTIESILYLNTPSTVVLKGPGSISGLRWKGEPGAGEWNFPKPIMIPAGQAVVIERTECSVLMHRLGDTLLQITTT